MSTIRSTHRHPLILMEVSKIDSYDVCYGCKKPISDSVYWCNECQFYLHKDCAELTQSIQDPMHPKHPLTLRGVVESEFSFGLREAHFDYICSLCREPRSENKDGFLYVCYGCKFYICLPCFFEERRITPKFHEHPLVFLFRPASFYCNACDKKDEDSSYICHTCPFWIHKSCASFLITNQVDDQHHPLTLVKPPTSHLSQLRDICKICGIHLTPENWLYCCDLCEYSIHVKCSISRSKLLRGSGSENENNELFHLRLLHFPLADDFAVLPRHPGEQISDEENKREPKIKVWSHEHPLILYDGHDTILCDGCVQPISLPCYTCVQCNYFLHLSCVNLPHFLDRPNHSVHQGHARLLCLRREREPHSLFRCSSCGLYGNGFFYADLESIKIHLKCVFLPTTIMHETHKHHLVQTSRDLLLECRACNVTCPQIGYRCQKCNFGICFYCALLPCTLRHRWDAHPLTLSYPPIENHPDEYYCEICEIEIEPGCWIYHCCDCDYSFHPKCVRDEYSNVKFGGTHKVEDHSHPLIFTRRMKKVRNYSCDHMFDDEKPLYECAECNYTICLKCIC